MTELKIPAEWLLGATYGPQDLAKLFDVSTQTVKRWADRGIIGSFRTPAGARRFPECEVLRIMGGQEPASQLVRDRAAADSARYRDKWENGWHRGHTFPRTRPVEEDDA